MSIFKSNLILLLVAAIWGFAFVAQRTGMEHVGPFTFTGIRFLLGSMTLVPLIFMDKSDRPLEPAGSNSTLLPGMLAGTVLFIAVSLQQVGIIYTTAGKAAFITGLYTVLVPVISILLRQSVGKGTWIGCLLAVTGLYFLCIKESFSIGFGDLLELVGALFWAFHILIIGYFSPKTSAFKLSFAQFLTCGLLGLGVAAFTETMAYNRLMAAAVPILYGGICSVGIAYTLQVVAQKQAHPAHAAIILSLESVFAAVGGWLILGEFLSLRAMTGCALMLAGMIISQLGSSRSS